MGIKLASGGEGVTKVTYLGVEVNRATKQLTSLRENSVVSSGFESFAPVFPALKRRATLGCPSGQADFDFFA
jgi:hypothetical protein